MRTVFAFASSNLKRGYRSKLCSRNIRSETTYRKSYHHHFLSPFDLPFFHHHSGHNSANAYRGMHAFTRIRGGGDRDVNHGSELDAQTAASSSSFSPSNAPSSVEEEMKKLSIECEKQGISSGIEKLTFGDYQCTTTTPNKHRVIFILGGPGAGKGTQCENIISSYQSVHHLSVGELLRNAPKNNPHAELIEQCLVAGKIVPVEISLSLLRDAMDQVVSTATTTVASKDITSTSTLPIFLVDGFPRNFDNLSGWITSMPDYATALGVLLFDCPIEELEKRILDRGKTSGRSDDNLPSAQKRFRTFQEQTMPVVKIFEDLEKRGGEGLKVFHIAGQHSREQVWKETQSAMNQYLLGDVLACNAKLINSIENKDFTAYLCLCNCKMLMDGAKKEKSLRDLEEENNDDALLKEAFTDLEFVDKVGDSRQLNKISNVGIEFHDCTVARVSYDREISLENGQVISKMHETRVWKHEGEKGWQNVHFIRE